jgi:CheY-like chemotaxis protein
MEKKKVLVVEDLEDLRDLIVTFLEAKFGCDVVAVSDAPSAIRELDQQSGLFAVVSDYKLERGTGGDVFKHMESKGLKYPFILCSSHDPASLPEFADAKIAGYAEKPSFLRPLERIFKEIIGPVDVPGAAVGIPVPPPGSPTREKLCRIRLTVLLKVNALDFDAYLKLSENHFVQVFRRGSIARVEELERYRARTVDFLYIPESACEAFLRKWSADVVSLLVAESLELEVAQIIHSETQEAIHEISQTLGLTPQLKDLIRGTVELALKLLTTQPRFSELLKRFEVDSRSYIPSHSVLLAYVACSLASKAGWGSRANFLKLCLASMLHDLTLPNHELARCSTIGDSLIGNDGSPFTAEELESFSEHPAKAAELTRLFPEFPSEVDAIVLQHHELPDGGGFPRGLQESQIAPLSCLFILAHEMVKETIEKRKRFSVVEFFRIAEARFTTGKFKDLLAELRWKF